MLQCAMLRCCVAVAHVVVALHVLLRRCMCCCDIARVVVALHVLLRRCSSCWCGTTRVAVALQFLLLRRCDAARGYNVVTLQFAWLRCCHVVIRVVFFFFLNDYWQVQDSSTSLLVRVRKRETKSEKEQERALKPVLFLVLQASPLSSNPSLNGW